MYLIIMLLMFSLLLMWQLFVFLMLELIILWEAVNSSYLSQTDQYLSSLFKSFYERQLLLFHNWDNYHKLIIQVQTIPMLKKSNQSTQHYPCIIPFIILSFYLFILSSFYPFIFLFVYWSIKRVYLNINTQMSDNRLLLKEKDYQTLAYKRKIEFRQSTTDPFINPPKLKTKNMNSYKTPLFNQLNPLNRSQKAPSKPSTQASKMSTQATNNNRQVEQEEMQMKKIEITPWQTILLSFLKVYDVTKQSTDVQIPNAFGSQGLKAEDQMRQSASAIGKMEIKQQNRTISMKVYLKLLSDMKKDLKSKWQSNDKVGSLQITIQACKLLHDTSNAKFHALKFAYVMEIVEKFGIYVFERIKTLSFPNLTPDKIKDLSMKDLEEANIPQSAQQICRNWLLKISSIRQLIPRTIIETTLLRLYFFLDNGQNAKKAITRLCKTNRCFGEYINCIFYCTFLIRMARQVVPQNKDLILDVIDDVFFYIKQGKTKFSRQDISYDQFFVILQPFFKSGFQSLSENLTKDKFKRFCTILPQNPHPIILKNFILSFSPSLLVFHSVDIAKMLQKIYKDQKYEIYKIMLEKLRGMTFPQSGQFIIILWTDFSQLKDLSIMLQFLGPFSQIIFRNLPRYQKNKFYSLILDHFNSCFQNFQNTDNKIFSSFQTFLSGMLQRTQDLKDILALQPFLQIISYFPNQIKTQISVSIVQTFVMRDETKINDPVIVHIMLSLFKNLERVQIKSLTLKFLDKIDFGNDLQQMLNFFAEIRATFGHIQQITTSLIYRAAGLTIKARKLSRGKITQKLISFLQAALAFCYITVPVIQNSHVRLSMYIYLSEVALSNNLISQATSLIKTCITQLSQTDSQSDLEICRIYSRIISFLIVMPDDPENQFLFLFNGLYQAFSVSRFKTNYESIVRFQFYTQCIVYISCQAQERLPFHIEGVVSNDGLFKSKEFRKALIEKIYEVFAKLQTTIDQIGKLNSAQVDPYTLKNLISSLMTLIGVFDDSPRLISFVKICVRVIDKISERVLPKDKIFKKNYSTALSGLNKLLKENQIKLEVKIGPI